MSALILLHIVAGAVAITAGFAAPFSRKGGTAHRLAGQTFLASILVLGLSGALVASVRAVPLSLLNGLLICYFVLTSFSVMKQRPLSVSRIDKIMATIIWLLIGGYGYFSLQAAKVPGGELGGFGSEAFIAFGAVALVCALGDVRFVLGGGLAGRQRVVRHLWRMFFPLLMATAAFFLGQARLFPDSLQKIEVLVLPVALVLLGMFIWMAAVALGNRYAMRPASSTATPEFGADHTPSDG